MRKRAVREQSKHVAVKRSTADVLDDLCLQYSKAIGNGDVKRWQLVDIMLKSCVIECIECGNPVFVFSPTSNSPLFGFMLNPSLTSHGAVFY